MTDSMFQDKYPLLTAEERMEAIQCGVMAAEAGYSLDNLKTIDQFAADYPEKSREWAEQFRAAVIDCYNGAKADLAASGLLSDSFGDQLLAALLGDPTEMGLALASSDDNR